MVDLKSDSVGQTSCQSWYFLCSGSEYHNASVAASLPCTGTWSGSSTLRTSGSAACTSEVLLTWTKRSPFLRIQHGRREKARKIRLWNTDLDVFCRDYPHPSTGKLSGSKTVNGNAMVCCPCDEFGVALARIECCGHDGLA
jgi:hypothetical protein